MATETQTAETTEQIARDYFARVAARDPDGMMEFWEPGKGANIHGLVELVVPDSYRAWFADLFAAIPDLDFEVEEVVADETRAAVRWRARGTFKGTTQLEGFDPNGAAIEMVGLTGLRSRTASWSTTRPTPTACSWRGRSARCRRRARAPRRRWPAPST